MEDWKRNLIEDAAGIEQVIRDTKTIAVLDQIPLPVFHHSAPSGVIKAAEINICGITFSAWGLLQSSIDE